jgi:hypothetical protein
MMSGPTIHFRQSIRPPDVIPAATVSDSGSCPVCPHPTDSHDAIGVRFCAATAAGQFERGCVCAKG